MREKIRNLVDHKWFNRFIITVIILNSIAIGVESYKVESHVTFLHYFDYTCLSIYVIEMLLKLYAYHLDYFRSAWNWLDFTIVTVAVSSLFLPVSGAFAVFRMLRILRVLRLLSVVPVLQRVVNALLASIPGVSASFGLLAIIFYMYAVIAVNMFGVAFPDWFGTLEKSLYTLFQIMTLESWSMGIARPVIAMYPDAWIFFITFILLSTFMILNFVIGLIVDSVQLIREEEKKDAQQALEGKVLNPEQELDVVMDSVEQLQEQLANLKRKMEKGAS
jgi:voltage-gated sodium channel